MASTVGCVGLSMLTDLGLVLFSGGRIKKKLGYMQCSGILSCF